MPPVLCLARFESYEPAKSADLLSTILNLVWFQDDFALPDYPTIRRQIEKLNWDKLATEIWVWDF